MCPMRGGEVVSYLHTRVLRTEAQGFLVADPRYIEAAVVAMHTWCLRRLKEQLP